MDLKLKAFNFDQAVARAGLGRDGMPLARTLGTAAGSAVGAAADAAKGAQGFQSAMTQALSAVSNQQMQAEHLQRELSLDNPTVSLEKTMMAMQKAQIGFQATLQVRNRMVQAYSDIMNMNV
jgi:flagellar hook-basal body complex protein FliE